MNRQIFINEASFFASIPMIVITGGLGLVAIYHSFRGVAAVLLFLMMVSLIAVIYNRISLKSLSLRFRCPVTACFQGDRIAIGCEVRNDGPLPVFQSRVRIPIFSSTPVDPSGCDGYRALTNQEISKSRLYGQSVVGVLEAEIDCLHRKETAACTFHVKAVRRGVWALHQTLVYCSDVTGLTKEGKEVGDAGRILIYPALVAVNTELFVHNQLFHDNGLKTQMEEVTLIERNRPYQSSDPVRSINWSLLARGGGLSVNKYGKSAMKNIHFIIDSESFNAGYLSEDIFERVLSVVFSEMVALQRRGMGCGLSLPAQDRAPAVNLFYKGRWTIHAIGAYLAECSMRSRQQEPSGATVFQGHSSMSATIIRAREDREKREGIQSSVSRFSTEELLHREKEVGEYFYVTYDVEKMTSNGLLKALSSRKKLSVITYKPYQLTQKEADAGKRILNFLSITEGG